MGKQVHAFLSFVLHFDFHGLLLCSADELRPYRVDPVHFIWVLYHGPSIVSRRGFFPLTNSSSYDNTFILGILSLEKAAKAAGKGGFL